MKLKAEIEGVLVSVENRKAEDVYQAFDLVYQLLSGMGFHNESITKGIVYMYESYVPNDEYIGAPGSPDDDDLNFIGVNFTQGES